MRSYRIYLIVRTDRPEQTVSTGGDAAGVSSGSTLFATHLAIFRTTSGCKLYLFKFYNQYGKEEVSEYLG